MGLSLIPPGTTVTVETKWFPPLTVDLTDTGAKEPNIFLRILKPKVTVRIQGQVITHVAPAGEPAPNEWKKVKIGLAIAAAVVAFSVLRIFK